jgi:Thiamine pyrophosphate-requiring enzymes [acetolactate synthase, pyruvate dehydrogenase (cytochrome), glyoxylate carboligase, phosphonopyruvate decarboxylase]
MKVDEAVGRALVSAGVRRVFGVVGSGNFVATNAMIAAGAEFVATRHENGAVVMADGHARMTGEVTVASVHQGPGFTNALTGLVEAWKSRSPVVLLAAAIPEGMSNSNFYLDQKEVVRALGIRLVHLEEPEDAVKATVEAVRIARRDRTAVVLNLLNDVQRRDVPDDVVAELSRAAEAAEPPRAEAADPGGLRLVRDRILSSSRPVFLVGRGASNLAPRIADLADRVGALLATTAPCRGLFADHEWSIDVSGGFSSPGTLELLRGSDLLVAFGAGLNRWTTLDGSLLENPTVVQIDRDPAAFGRHFPVDLPIEADAGAMVAGLEELLPATASSTRYRTDAVRHTIGGRVPWGAQPYADTSTDSRIDPRTLTRILNDELPRERTVAVDGGNFNGYPAMFLDVRGREGMILPLSFASIGLSIPAAIGAALARPDLLAIAGVGDGGFLMSHVELETAVRLGVNLAVLVYDDAAYGAEVHHFGPHGHPVDTVTFPEVDLAAIARGYGCTAFTVRTEDDCRSVGAWYREGGRGPVVIDAKITSFACWVLEHTFTAE